MNLKQRIKAARERKGLSKSALGKRLGLSASSAVQWESDDGTSPSVDNLIKIAQELGVSFEWLATGRGHMDLLSSVAEEPTKYHAGRTLSVDEARVLDLYREISSREQQAVHALMEALTKT